MKTKLLILTTATLLGAAMTACSSETYQNDAKALPLDAQQYLADNFDAAVSVVKVDNTITGSPDEYEVTLADGTKIKFDGDGIMEEVEAARDTILPADVIPAGIITYLTNNHNGAGVVKLERERNGYDITLANGIEMKFDSNGKLLDYDD